VTAQEALRELEAEMRACRADPLRFVRLAYPWGEDGPLQREEPEKWQCEFLEWLGSEIRDRNFDGFNPVRPIRCAVSSGHGIGKSTLVAWLVNYIMSTRPWSKGTVTANSWDQLKTKTWASVMSWTRLCITADWFDINSSEMRSKDPEAKDEWRCSTSGSKDENSDAFQGQHAAKGTSFYIFDEDSGIGPKIHEAAEGGMTDGEPMEFRFGNCTRNSGPFHEACFGRGRDSRKVFIIDSRSVRRTNKELFAEWEESYGEDSDFFRVRVRGLPPRASELQFIDQGRVLEAQKREVVLFPDEPLLVGVDVSDGGSAWNVIRFRRGMDARNIPAIRIPGEAVRNDRGVLLAKLADVLSQNHLGYGKVEAMFIDSAFGAPYVERLQRMGFKNVHEVRFGGTSPDARQKNLRAYMWNRMKEWLSSGAIDPADDRLETDLTAPGYHIDKQDKLVIESKEDMAKRGVASPDDGDALALTFAAAVRGRPRAPARGFKGQEFAWA